MSELAILRMMVAYEKATEARLRLIAHRVGVDSDLWNGVTVALEADLDKAYDKLVEEFEKEKKMTTHSR